MAFERCRKPVIAAIEGAHWYCESLKDAFFSAKEVALGLTAGSWTLQRFSGIVEFGDGFVFLSFIGFIYYYW
ncbi:hypothetical protein SADUNF_Sadunf03G0127800 [Salix dunnii]|uniref:Uncharacterized protein n=1 Tax=Salix dunnii TaxID=1413687 RepID=A0A835N4K6_9ROSI|nr:hypothetical protein SADUNF_Sadunf03G0127800 [Salix dunnii]